MSYIYIYIYIYGAPILDVSRSHTTTHHSRKDSSGRVISSSQRPLPDNTQHSQQTNIHASGRIRTHDLSRWAYARLLKSWVRIPPGACIFVCCECRMLSGRSLCDKLITRPEVPYRLCCVAVCDLETSRIGAPYIYLVAWVEPLLKNWTGACFKEKITPSW
jgi:hypothetical protein